MMLRAKNRTRSNANLLAYLFAIAVSLFILCPGTTSAQSTSICPGGTSPQCATIDTAAAQRDELFHGAQYGSGRFLHGSIEGGNNHWGHDHGVRQLYLGNNAAEAHRPDRHGHADTNGSDPLSEPYDGAGGSSHGRRVSHRDATELGEHADVYVSYFGGSASR